MPFVEFRLGGALVEVGDESTVTTFADGAQVVATYDEQDGQREVAARLGITVRDMNRTHDLAHSLLAVFMGREVSPTLWAVAHGNTYPMWWREEAAVLELQALANTYGISMLDIAARYSNPEWHVTETQRIQNNGPQP